jgi:hypothetical protein
MEDELIITVVATGFDSAYFSDNNKDKESAVNDDSRDDNISRDDVNLSDIDVDEEIVAPPAADFTSEEEPTTAWHASFGADDKTDDEPVSPFGERSDDENSADDKYDTPSFLRRRFGRKNKMNKENQEDEEGSKRENEEG